MIAMFGIFGAISIGASAVSLGAGLVEKWARDKKNEELMEKKGRFYQMKVLQS